MKTYIPFSGFYNSIHDEELDRALDDIFQNDNGDIYTSLRDKAFDSMNWKNVHTEYAKKYTKGFATNFEIDLAFSELSSPKYYNFETDRIFCDIEFSEVERVFGLTNKIQLEKLIKENFTSYDGFHSFYSNELSTWLDTPLKEWDLNQVGTLIECYINQETRFDICKERECLGDYPEDVTNRLVESNIENPDKVFKILNYLQERSERV